jgi:hypothetical protein
MLGARQMGGSSLCGDPNDEAVTLGVLGVIPSGRPFCANLAARRGKGRFGRLTGHESLLYHPSVDRSLAPAAAAAVRLGSSGATFAL